MNRKPEPDHSFKILLLGSNSVGKTSLMSRFTHNTFTVNLPTLGAQSTTHKLIIGDQLVKFVIWDSAGQDRYKMVFRPLYKTVGIIFLVYNICDRQSFQDLDDCLKEIEKYAREDVRMLLIGNKCDEEKERQVSYEQGKAYAGKLGIKFIETSAKNNVNVGNAFATIVKQLMAEAQLARQKIPLKKLRNEDGATNKCY